MVEFYTPGASWLLRTDPRVKLAFVAGFTISLLMLRLLWLTAAAVLLVLLLYAAARLPAERAIRIMRVMAPVSLLMAVLRAVFYPAGRELLAWGPIHLTVGGLADGAALGLRLLAMALAVFLWLYTTPSPAIVHGFVRLGMPYAWGLSLSMALRTIPSMGRNYEIILQSQRARGLDLGTMRGLQRMRAMLPGLLALIVSSFRASEHMAQALEARAFGAQGVRRTYLSELRFRVSDWLFLAVTVLGFLALIYLRIRFNFGATSLGASG